MTGPAKWRRWRGWPDVLAVCGYLVLAGYVTERMWRFLDRYLLQTNTTDQIQFEYFLVHAVRVVTHGENPFYTTTMNHPSGVNLMANTATLGLHLPLVPVTMLFGPQVSFAVMVTGALAGTAAAWYWLFSRHLVGSRFAAFVAGGFCGFAPGMVSQADGHPNIAAQFLVPIIVWRVLRLREPGHALRNGLILALLVTYQAFINEEILLLTALAAGLFVGAARCTTRPRHAARCPPSCARSAWRAWWHWRCWRTRCGSSSSDRSTTGASGRARCGTGPMSCRSPVSRGPRSRAIRRRPPG